MTFGPSDQERGREPVASTGRGGAGNAIRSPSRGRPGQDKEEREAAAAYHASHGTTHSGRGGVGNVRSPSRDPTERLKAEEAEKQEHVLQAEALRQDAQHGQHTGRGGVGNIKGEHGHSHSQERGRGSDSHHGGVGAAIRSMSRSRSREPRSSSANRSQATADGEKKLDAVDEASSASSTANGSAEHPHQGFVSKIASHLPGHHKA
ncbi:hypothetical protein FA10DRAFT_26873 [Acaromyces ingoldii]|uniref:Uncharacterized protein n=1 Tax=Acaromyces ingoldii TaxID=215250 RepID=A0A316YWU2_9BASI|nr:hypothetical protein FA10DRAFT_26873 [Acaromyces ingoldii]PWN93592.1 hypothetical protein FA10DRAFT_26873 [Acaromyces ingoldii]